MFSRRNKTVKGAQMLGGKKSEAFRKKPQWAESRFSLAPLFFSRLKRRRRKQLSCRPQPGGIFLYHFSRCRVGVTHGASSCFQPMRPQNAYLLPGRSLVQVNRERRRRVCFIIPANSSVYPVYERASIARFDELAPNSKGYYNSQRHPPKPPLDGPTARNCSVYE